MSKMIPPGWIRRKKGRYYIVLYLHRDTGEPIQKWVATGMKMAGSLRKAERMLSRLQNGIAEGTINLGVTAVGHPFRDGMGQAIGALSVAALPAGRAVSVQR